MNILKVVIDGGWIIKENQFKEIVAMITFDENSQQKKEIKEFL